MSNHIDRHRNAFASARIARLATVGHNSQPHLVPVTFAAADDTIVMAVDHKPKTTTNLKRIRNITENNRVSVLVDYYNDQDWSQLWWVRADGIARLLTREADRHDAVRQLQGKYVQYQITPPSGPVIGVDVQKWQAWAALAGAITG